MELHLTTTTNNVYIWHSAFENCGEKYDIYHILVLIFHINNPKVKVHRGEALKRQIELWGFDCMSFYVSTNAKQ